mmetsp:Transcript_26711/g.74584  ORF Transcript_26711/g.74584 Transcript_26711/m.74584 type:complete len:260 (-) Transcript_26711:180-959(-)
MSGSTGGLAFRMSSRSWGMRSSLPQRTSAFSIVLKVMTLLSYPRDFISSYSARTLSMSFDIAKPLRIVVYVTVLSNGLWASSSQTSWISCHAPSAEPHATKASTMQPNVMAEGCTSQRRISFQVNHTWSTSRACPKALMMDPYMGDGSLRSAPSTPESFKWRESTSSRPTLRLASVRCASSTSSVCTLASMISSDTRSKSVACCRLVTSLRMIEQATGVRAKPLARIRSTTSQAPRLSPTDAQALSRPWYVTWFATTPW